MVDNTDNNKRIAKNSLVLYIRTLVMMFISLYTGRVVLEVLGFEDFGIYNAVGGIVTMLSFLNASMIGATQRFLTFELGRGNQVEFNRVFSTSIIIHTIIALIVLLLGETIGLWFFQTQMNIPTGRMYAAMWVYQFSIFTYIVSIMSVPYYAVVVAHERMKAFAYFSIIDAVLKLGILYFIVYLNKDRLILYAVLMFAIQLFIRLLYTVYCKKNFKEISFHWYYNKYLLKKMLSFAGWTISGGISYSAYNQGIVVLLNVFFGPLINAAKGIAVQVQNAALSLCRNVQLALNPQITKSYVIGDLAYMYKLILASSRYSFFLLLLLTLPILFETEFILNLWLKNIPDYTVSFVRLTTVVVLLEVLADPLIKSAHATGKIKKFQIWENSIMLLILPISYFGLKLGAKPEFVFIVYIVMASFTQLVRVCIVSSLIGLSLNVYYNKVIKVIIKVSLLSSIVPIILSILLPKYNIYVSVFICCVSVVSVFVSVFIVGTSGFERQLVIDKVNQYRNKIN